jgi:phosphonoacetaldehyde hydrolase
MSFRYQRRYQGPVRGVILDWAGTTVDHGCMAPAATFIEAFHGFGVEITPAEARAPMGMAKWHHIQAITRQPRVAEAWRERHGALPGDAEVDRLYDRFLPLQVETVARHSDVIDGVAKTVVDLRAAGLKIGSTTGYPREVAAVVSEVAAAQGYTPDAVVCAGDTRLGRPGPYMAFKAMIDLELSPVEAVVKVGDTVVDVEEGLNAGLWSVGVAATGNEVGLTAADFAALPADRRQSFLAAARAKLLGAGAHYVIDRLTELPAVIDDITRRLQQGKKP